MDLPDRCLFLQASLNLAPFVEEGRKVSKVSVLAREAVESKHFMIGLG
jgi:hypothetical protein